MRGNVSIQDSGSCELCVWWQYQTSCSTSTSSRRPPRSGRRPTGSQAGLNLLRPLHPARLWPCWPSEHNCDQRCSATKDWPTYPGTVQIYGDKRWWDGEVVDEGVKLQHEPELVRGSDELKRFVILIHFIISATSEVMNWIRNIIVLTLMKK